MHHIEGVRTEEPMSEDLRYVYAAYRSRERAEAALDGMFAIGEVLEGENPRIEIRGRTKRYVITLPAE